MTTLAVGYHVPLNDDDELVFIILSQYGVCYLPLRRSGRSMARILHASRAGVGTLHAVESFWIYDDDRLITASWEAPDEEHA